MWIEERLRLAVSHHRHGVKPPVPGGTGLPSLHHWGFLFLHLKSKPGLGSQQSSTLSLSLSSLSLTLFLLHDWAESHTLTHTNTADATHICSFQSITSLSVSVWYSICFRYQNMNLCRWDEGDNITNSITASLLCHLLLKTTYWSCSLGVSNLSSYNTESSIENISWNSGCRNL